MEAATGLMSLRQANNNNIANNPPSVDTATSSSTATDSYSQSTAASSTMDVDEAVAGGCIQRQSPSQASAAPEMMETEDGRHDGIVNYDGGKKVSGRRPSKKRNMLHAEAASTIDLHQPSSSSSSNIKQRHDSLSSSPQQQPSPSADHYLSSEEEEEEQELEEDEDEEEEEEDAGSPGSSAAHVDDGTPREFICEWGDCHSVFIGDLEAFVAHVKTHVNQQQTCHCHWRSCKVWIKIYLFC